MFRKDFRLIFAKFSTVKVGIIFGRFSTVEIAVRLKYPKSQKVENFRQTHMALICTSYYTLCSGSQTFPVRGADFGNHWLIRDLVLTLVKVLKRICVCHFLPLLTRTFIFGQVEFLPEIGWLLGQAYFVQIPDTQGIICRVALGI